MKRVGFQPSRNIHRAQAYDIVNDVFFQLKSPDDRKRPKATRRNSTAIETSRTTSGAQRLERVGTDVLSKPERKED
ncbi:hypothetical protein ACFFWD_07830 [Bradyrhizobium erythrophlei]|uniref:hypothetical protein n=1 Tax=Bradyrhizobium erythrophlei TaxID=1437360 RepID=UPI0035F01235